MLIIFTAAAPLTECMYPKERKRKRKFCLCFSFFLFGLKTTLQEGFEIQFWPLQWTTHKQHKCSLVDTSDWLYKSFPKLTLKYRNHLQELTRRPLIHYFYLSGFIFSNSFKSSSNRPYSFCVSFSCFRTRITCRIQIT